MIWAAILLLVANVLGAIAYRRKEREARFWLERYVQTACLLDETGELFDDAAQRLLFTCEDTGIINLWRRVES